MEAIGGDSCDEQEGAHTLLLHACCAVAVAGFLAMLLHAVVQLDSLEAGQQQLADALEQLPSQLASLISVQLRDELGSPSV